MQFIAVERDSDGKVLSYIDMDKVISIERSGENSTTLMTMVGPKNVNLPINLVVALVQERMKLNNKIQDAILNIDANTLRPNYGGNA